MTNVFYIKGINKIGGIEQYIYELARKYQDLDITLYYTSTDQKQLYRLSKLIRCIKWNGKDKIKCERFFTTYSLDMIDYVEAKEYILINHTNYKGYKMIPPTHPKITKYFAVSKDSADSFTDLTGLKCEVCYNPITIDKEPRILHLISAQRLTKEKGGERIKHLIRELEKANIPFEWQIFSDRRLDIESPNVIYREPTLDIRRYIKDSDYMVLLSDFEGFSYGIYESLCLETPVIVTRLPILDELGVIDGVNGIVLDYDLSNLDLFKIYNSKLEFNYKQKEDIYSKLLVNKQSTYKEELKEMLEVKAKQGFFDMVEKVNRHVGETFIITKARYNQIQAVKDLVEIIKEEPKETIKETKKTVKKAKKNK